MGSKQVTIVTYHYVRELEKSRYPEIRGLELDRFRKQLQYFQERYTYISITELIDAIHQNRDLPENALLLTFNDNYLDHFRHVFPILDELKIQGCFYPEIRAVEEDIVLPNHKIHYILSNAPSPNAVVECIFDLLDSLRDEFKLDQKESYFRKLAIPSSYDSKEVVFIKKLLQSELDDQASDRIIDQLFNEFVDVMESVLSKELYMDKKHIQCMLRHGMHFGIIGYNHKRLPSLSKDEQVKEIELSKKFLLDSGVDAADLTVSYPWGAYNRDLFEILENNHIQAAFTGQPEKADLNHHYRYELPRYDTNHFQV